VTDDIRERIVQFLPRLRRFAYALTRDLDRGDDLVQETCVHALSRLEQFQPGTRLDSWMFRIAQTRWIDRMRSQSVRGTPLDLDAALEVSGEDGRAVAEGRLTLARVGEAMARLSPEQQLLIALVAVDGLSYKEVAQLLDVPIGTVMSRLARARLKLFQFAEGASDSPANAMESHRDRAD
jgi:RNA polymerase sigma-70 factor, ECF subfamily